MKPQLIIVGGFLGAGKTSLLYETAKVLTHSGHKVGLITNDQAPDLVDTQILESNENSTVSEVSGSCFCCNFNGFTSAINELVAQGCTHIIAEPVGSCTDLSATIMRPLRDKLPHIHLAPLSVLVSPARLEELSPSPASLMHEDARYILNLQLKEADYILLTKADTLSEEELDQKLAYLHAEFPTTRIASISAKTGTGITSWLSTLLDMSDIPGNRYIDVDYDRYAIGEAALGWLNATIELSSPNEENWEVFAHTLMSRLHQELKTRHAEIGHIKLIIKTNSSSALINLNSLNETIVVRSDSLPIGTKAKLTFNARAQIEHSELKTLLYNLLKETGIAYTVIAVHSLTPGRPNPTHRYTSPSS